jgi:molybdenum cofactor synthesis domain-containing protein
LGGAACYPARRVKTAGILVIGNEILSGKTDDTNARFLIGQLRELGVALRRIQVIPDVLEDIAGAVHELSERFDHVFTSGGVGPTHDDLTMEGIARAFGTRVVRQPELEASLRAYYGERLNERNLRMAEVPEGAQLLRASEIQHWPVIAYRNIYILPGVPEIFRRKFLAIRDRFRAEPFFLRVVYLAEEEGAVAGVLDRVDAAFPTVDIGSYPKLDPTGYRVKVTLEGKDADAVERACATLLSLLPPAVVVRTE